MSRAAAERLQPEPSLGERARALLEGVETLDLAPLRAAVEARET